MKILVISVLVFAVLVPASGRSRDNSASGKVDQEIKRVQNELIDAYLHQDLAALDRIMADDYIFIDDLGGVIAKAQMIASFKSGARQMTSYTIDEENVRVYGNAAVMMYRYTSKEQYKGQDASGERRLMRVFVKRNGRWQMVAGQETRIAAR